jgi:hypothetical protein
MALGGVAAMYASAREMVDRNRQTAGLSSAPGVIQEVVGKRTNLSGKFVWYQYELIARLETPAGEKLVGASGVTSSSLKRGDRIKVLYDPAGAAEARLDTTNSDYFEMSLFFVLGVGLEYFALRIMPRLRRWAVNSSRD